MELNEIIKKVSASGFFKTCFNLIAISALVLLINLNYQVYQLHRSLLMFDDDKELRQLDFILGEIRKLEENLQHIEKSVDLNFDLLHRIALNIN